LATYVFMINYDRRGNAVGEFLSPIPPLTLNGVPDFADGDSISYQYNFVSHGIAQGENSSVINNSQISASPVQNGGGPFPDGAYTYNLDNTNNFTVALGNTTTQTEKWRIQGSFISSLTNPGVVVKWDPECDVGSGG